MLKFCTLMKLLVRRNYFCRIHFDVRLMITSRNDKTEFYLNHLYGCICNKVINTQIRSDNFHCQSISLTLFDIENIVVTLQKLYFFNTISPFSSFDSNWPHPAWRHHDSPTHLFSSLTIKPSEKWGFGHHPTFLGTKYQVCWL